MKKCPGSVKKPTIAIPGILILLFFIVFYFYLRTPIFIAAKPQCFFIKSGESFKAFTETLSAHSRLPFPVWFKWYGKLSGKSKKLKIGEYCFSQGTTISQVMQVITQGKVTRREFTIISGRDFLQLKQKLLISPGFKSQLENTSSQQLAYLLKLPRENFEGEFLPETYGYAYPASDVDLLIESHELLVKKLYLSWNNRAENLPYKNPYQALIAASIIEKESAISSDRKLISGVIVNRLNKHMRLQMDPTVIYGLKNKTRLTRKDLKTDTPYNTYMHWGLPPTPICMPSLDAIEAALHPVNTEYLYFVSKGKSGKGYHEFSKTLVEQRSAINKYLLNQ